MTTDATQTQPPLPRKPGRALKIVATLFILLVVLLLGGSITFYQVGKPDPKDPATAQLAWGDRFEKRMDAIIDKKKSAWADHLEARLDKLKKRIGWN